MVHLETFVFWTKSDELGKVEKIREDSLDSIPAPSNLVKIQIIGGKVYLR